MKQLTILLCGALAVAGSWTRREETAIEKLQGYRSWHLVTSQAIDMTPAIALSCIGPSKWDTDPNPHVPRMFKVYVNILGKAALLSNGKKPFPIGSMIVKEKFVRPTGPERWSPVTLPKDAKPELLTAMVKREKGFDKVIGDWEYIVLSGDAKKKTTEGLKHCASCHLNRKETGYVFGNYGRLTR